MASKPKAEHAAQPNGSKPPRRSDGKPPRTDDPPAIDDPRRIMREAAWSRMFGRNDAANPFAKR